MNNIFEKLFSLGKKISMTESEKNKIRQNLAIHMNHHPVQIPSIYFFRSIAIGAFAILLFISSGTTMVASAQKSLPGEFLYPLKRASESVKKITLSSATEKADYELELIEKRFAEANTLLQQKKLDPKIETMISESIKDHSENLEKETIKLTSVNPTEALEISTRLQGILETQTSELLAINTQTSEEKESTSTLPPLQPTLLALATYEASQKIMEKQKKIEEVILVDATSSTQTVAEEKYTAILALTNQHPEFFQKNEITTLAVPELMTAFLVAADTPTVPSLKEVVSTAQTLLPEPAKEPKQTLADLFIELQNAYTEKQYGKIIILANDIEKQLKEKLTNQSQATVLEEIKPVEIVNPE